MAEITPIQLFSPPVFQGPIQLVKGLSHRGGGRGYIATETIRPGTLLMSEEPFLYWPKSTKDQLNMATLKSIYKHERSKQILECLSLVHPVSLEIVPEEMITRLEKEYDKDITHISHTFTQSRGDIIRLLLVLQCSSFHSGIYLHFSMFNHSCRPNAIKFQPEDSPVSQIRATQVIEKRRRNHHLLYRSQRTDLCCPY